MMTTQIGGKYHLADDSVFRLKKIIAQLNIRVTHPIANEIRDSTGRHSLAFDPDEHTFSDVERHYYESIRTCDFHTVCNRFKDDIGYIGGSASLELAFAMCHQRPIILLHSPNLAPTVDPLVRDFLLKRLHRANVHNFLSADASANIAAITNLSARLVDYGVAVQEQHTIQECVDDLICGLEAEHAAT
jgi:hypothetical protein